MTELKEKKEKKQIIFLPKEYKLVVNDKFELFYRGIIRAFDPYQYYIKLDCEKGKPYPRYFTFTPTAEEVGEYELRVRVFDNLGELLDENVTKLVVVEAKAPSKKANILCIGDSLTCAGYWSAEGFRRFALSGGEPEGLGFTDSLNLIGTVKKAVGDTEIGHEGYGSWQWKTFCTSSVQSKTSAVWVDVLSHNKTQEDQHSVWVNNNRKWILETIEEKRLKFKRGPENSDLAPELLDEFVCLENAVNCENIKIEGYKYESGNPFWNEEIDNIDFIHYCKKNNFPHPDYVYILLSWNGLYIPYNDKFTMQEEYAPKLISRIHEQFPDCKIRCMGIQLNSLNGGIAANYGAKGPYHDVYGDVVTVFNYNKWLENLCLSDEFKDFTEYVDVMGQFDVEYNMPYKMEKVNARNNQTEMIGTNGVHPSLNGYMQIGDIFFRSLVHEMAKR